MLGNCGEGQCLYDSKLESYYCICKEGLFGIKCEFNANDLSDLKKSNKEFADYINSKKGKISNKEMGDMIEVISNIGAVNELNDPDVINSLNIAGNQMLNDIEKGDLPISKNVFYIADKMLDLNKKSK